MIIQTGMRTDIPAFYSEWLANRIKEGYVLVRNPYNPLQVARYDLSFPMVYPRPNAVSTRLTTAIRLSIVIIAIIPLSYKFPI